MADPNEKERRRETKRAKRSCWVSFESHGSSTDLEDTGAQRRGREGRTAAMPCVRLRSEAPKAAADVEVLTGESEETDHNSHDSVDFKEHAEKSEHLQNLAGAEYAYRKTKPDKWKRITDEEEHQFRESVQPPWVRRRKAEKKAEKKDKKKPASKSSAPTMKASRPARSSTSKPATAVFGPAKTPNVPPGALLHPGGILTVSATEPSDEDVNEEDESPESPFDTEGLDGVDKHGQAEDAEAAPTLARQKYLRSKAAPTLPRPSRRPHSLRPSRRPPSPRPSESRRPPRGSVGRLISRRPPPSAWRPPTAPASSADHPSKTKTTCLHCHLVVGVDGEVCCPCCRRWNEDPDFCRDNNWLNAHGNECVIGKTSTQKWQKMLKHREWEGS